jgi:hypothetical protein
MRPDDIESRLRSELRAELDSLDFTVDAQTVHRRLAERNGRGRWWLGLSRQLVLGAAGAVAALAIVMVVTIWLRGLSQLGPTVGSGSKTAPPPHVLVVRELLHNSELSNSSPVLEARLADPSTLKPVSGVPAITMGRFYQTALSHDGRTLAIVRWPGDNPSNGELILLNLEDGKQTSTGVRLDGEAPVMAFSDDDRSLTWVEGVRSPVNANYRMVRYPLGGKVQSHTALPRNFFPIDGRLQANGELVVFAAETGVSDGTPLAPHVLFIGADGNTRADIPLTDVLAGDLLQKDGHVAINNPGLAWDMSHGRLYVVHPDADVVTVVGLADAHVLARVDAAAHTTGFLGQLGVGGASAKLEPGNDRSAALSPEGSRLYAVGGVRRVVGNGPDMQFSQTPTGGFVLDTQSLNRIASIDLRVDRVLASPSGRALVFSGTTMDLAPEDQSEASARTELMVTDMELRVTARKSVPAHSWLIGLTANGSTAYVAEGRSVAALSLDSLTRVGIGSGYWVDPSTE